MDSIKAAFILQHTRDIYLELLREEVKTGKMTGPPDSEAALATYKQIADAVDVLFDAQVSYKDHLGDLE